MPLPSVGGDEFGKRGVGRLSIGLIELVEAIRWGSTAGGPDGIDADRGPFPRIGTRRSDWPCGKGGRSPWESLTFFSEPGPGGGATAGAGTNGTSSIDGCSVACGGAGWGFLMFVSGWGDGATADERLKYLRMVSKKL
jgi:hypothetical protein